MISLVVHGELPPQVLAEIFPQAGVELQSSAAYAFGTTRVTVLLGAKHFFRTDSWMGVALVAATDGTTQRFDIGHAGAGQGLIGAEWGAGNDLEASVYNALSQALQAHGLGPIS